MFICMQKQWTKKHCPGGHCKNYYNSKACNIANKSWFNSFKKSAPKVYTNTRFKDVTVTNLGNNKYRITGKAQIFEANFSWVIEDGHEELEKGNAMTDAGAPEWGNFTFTVNAKKKRNNSTLHLILFEASAKDGSRQYQLPVPLYWFCYASFPALVDIPQQSRCSVLWPTTEAMHRQSHIPCHGS